MKHVLGQAASERFKQLEGSAAAPAVVAWLRRVATEGGDADGYKINAFRVAAEVEVSRFDAVRAFLFATRLGITDLNWDVRCPSCGGAPDYSRHLMQLQVRAHCKLCDLRWTADFEESIEVTFTLNHDIRKLNYVDFRDRDLPGRGEYFDEISGREGRMPPIKPMPPPGASESGSAMLEAGELTCESPGHPDGRALLHVRGAPCAEEQAISFVVSAGGRVEPHEVTVRPGPVKVTVKNGLDKPWPLLIRPAQPPMNWVSAAYVTSLQDFRDLFSGEYLAPDVSIAIRSTTLMFTDIKGSTELYERFGDAKAYALVQEHFRLMSESIRRFEGGIVKTIGDAVMASFPVNRNAVEAAIDIQQRFASASPGPGLIEVKLGLHRGPVIAVTSNRALDFFGRSVNIAARVQGQSAPREVLMTEAVFSDPDVRALLAARNISTLGSDATLKGIAGTMKVFSATP
jgi:class 3 adenylate cyclase